MDNEPVNRAVFFAFGSKVQHGVFSYNECIFVLSLVGSFLTDELPIFLTVCFGFTHAYLLPAACQFPSMLAGKSVLKNIYVAKPFGQKFSFNSHLRFILEQIRILLCRETDC